MRFAILLVLMTFSALGNDTLVIEGLKTGKEEIKYLDCSLFNFPHKLMDKLSE